MKANTNGMHAMHAARRTCEVNPSPSSFTGSPSNLSVIAAFGCPSIILKRAFCQWVTLVFLAEYWQGLKIATSAAHLKSTPCCVPPMWRYQIERAESRRFESSALSDHPCW